VRFLIEQDRALTNIPPGSFIRASLFIFGDYRPWHCTRTSKDF
jgi:hypothetical protein